MLTIYKGSYTDYKRNQLSQIPVPSKKEFGGRSDRWQPIQHGDLVNELIEAVDSELGMKPINEHYAVSPNGAAVIGSFELGKERKRGKKTTVEPVGFMNTPQGTVQSLGFMHSNDTRRALQIAIGGRVLLCENGMAIGTVTMKRKHTSGLNLRDYVRAGVGRISPVFEAVDEAVGIINNYAMEDENHIVGLVELARKDIIPWHILGDVDLAWGHAVEEGRLDWVDPESGYSDDDWDFNQSLWDWYQAVTHVAKKVPPAKQLTALRHGFNTTVEFLPETEQNHILNSLSLDN